MNRILLRHGNTIRKFISFYQNEKDGSLYITQKRAGETAYTSYHHISDPEPEPKYIRTITSRQSKSFEVHYHTSGRINYPEPEFESIYGEPLTRITKPFWFASFVIRSFSTLDKHDTMLTKTDFTFSLEGDRNKPRQFDICISPSGSHITNYGLGHCYFTYAPFYTLNIIETEKPVFDSERDRKFSLLAPRKGLFSKQEIAREVAHIEFQQKRYGHNGPIIHGPNANNEYRIIFQTAATSIPNVLAEFPDRTWKIDIICVSKSEVRLRVINGSGNIVKTPVEFSRVKLSDNTATLCVDKNT